MTIKEWMPKAEDFFENWLIFGARWLLLPAYLMLVFSLVILAYKSLEEFVQLVVNLHVFDEASAIAQVLVIVDLVLVLNLVLMILFVGYMNFVSVIHPRREEDWPKWMGALDYSGLKIYVMGSIVAISAIKLLRAFLDVSAGGKIEPERLTWMAIIHMTFVASIVILAISNKLKTKGEPGHFQFSQFQRLLPDEPDTHQTDKPAHPHPG